MQSWLNYHHLLYFWTVVREGGIGPAAAKLNVSQPAISAQIKQLEGALGERLLRKVGRRLLPTDSGQLVLGYADEIFSLGSELLMSVQQRYGQRSARLHLGVTDSVPKMLVRKMLTPILRSQTPVRVTVREGRFQDLAPELVTFKLDAILADEPLGSTLAVNAFSTQLRHDAVLWAATDGLARKLKRGFPQSFNGTPVILPTEERPLRRTVEAWFLRNNIRPWILAEIQDTALMKDLAADGTGAVPLPESIMEIASKAFGLKCIGKAEEAFADLYLCTAERRIEHPLLKELLLSQK